MSMSSPVFPGSVFISWKPNVQKKIMYNLSNTGELVDLLGRVQLDYGDLLKASDPVIQRKRIEPSS